MKSKTTKNARRPGRGVEPWGSTLKTQKKGDPSHRRKKKKFALSNQDPQKKNKGASAQPCRFFQDGCVGGGIGIRRKEMKRERCNQNFCGQSPGNSQYFSGILYDMGGARNANVSVPKKGTTSSDQTQEKPPWDTVGDGTQTWGSASYQDD